MRNRDSLMPRVFSNLAMLIAAQLFVGHFASALADDQLVLEAGRPGSEAHRLGVGLSSLVKVVVLPKEGTDLRLADGGEEVDGRYLLVDRQDKLGTLLEDQPADAFRSIMAFNAEPSADGPPLELIAHADASPDAIYAFTRAIFENGPFLNNVNERIWDLSFDRALDGLQFPIHRGALRYYQESGGLAWRTTDALPSGAGIAGPGWADPDVAAESTFFVYFDGDGASLDDAARAQIAAACDHASAAKAKQLHVGGHGELPTIDAEKGLVDERVRAVIVALGLDQRCAGGVPIFASNEAGTTLSAELLGGSVDCVGITIMVPHEDL